MSCTLVIQCNGHLAERPQLEYVDVGGREVPRCTFIVVSNEPSRTGSPGRPRTLTIPWTAWGRHAQAHAGFLTTGSKVNVVGRVESRRFVARLANRDCGEPVFGFQFIAEQVHYLDSLAQREERIARHGNGSDRVSIADASGQPAAA